MISSLAMLRVAHQILAEATRATSKTKLEDAAKPIGCAPSHQALQEATGEPCCGNSGDGARHNHQQALPQQPAPKPDRRGPERHANAHFLVPLNDGLEHNAVNANQRQQQRESRESPDGRPPIREILSHYRAVE